MIVAVIGKGRNAPTGVEDLAHDVGTLLAGLGYTVVTGGLGGVMRAAALGASRAGGLVVSLIPEGREADAHPYATVPLRTGLPVPFRNALLGSCADAAVMLPGSHGTVQEAMVLLDRPVPIVAVGEHDGYRTMAVRRELPQFEDPALAVEHLGLILDPTHPQPSPSR